MAASGLDPMAYISRAGRKVRIAYPTMMTTTATMIASQGMPRTVL